jgi:hypothetical protein
MPCAFDASVSTRAVILGVLTGIALCACGGTNDGAPRRDVEQQLGFDQASLDARQARAEAQIHDCMKAEGFDYVPIDPVAQLTAMFGTTDLREQEKQFGYFVSTLYGRTRTQADPNERIRLALSRAERLVYDRVLGGDDPGATFQDAVDTGDFTKLGGCRRKAVEAEFGGTEMLMRIQERLDQLDERIVADPRMVKAVEKWSSCMARPGFRYTDPDAIDTTLLKRLETIVGPVAGKFVTGPPPGDTPRPYDHAALASLQHEEMATWRADTACERRYIVPVETVVRAQYEAEFRRHNAALFGKRAS